MLGSFFSGNVREAGSEGRLPFYERLFFEVETGIAQISLAIEPQPDIDHVGIIRGSIDRRADRVAIGIPLLRIFYSFIQQRNIS